MLTEAVVHDSGGMFNGIMEAYRVFDVRFDFYCRAEMLELGYLSEILWLSVMIALRGVL